MPFLRLTLILLVLAANLHAQDADEPLPPGAIARLGTTRLVHLGGLSAVAVSPDGKIVASRAGATETYNSICLWDTKTGNLIRGISGRGVVVTALAFDPD